MVIALTLLAASGIRADEIRLKDGTKITGTIVDYQDESFKVQTAYGFATVRKDSIAQIVPSDPDRSSEAAKANVEPASVSKPKAAQATPLSAVKTASTPAVSRGPVSPSGPLPSPRMSTDMPKPIAPASTAVPAASVAPAAPALPAPAPVPAAPPVPAAAIVPGPIRESVQGNLYVNETYRFQLYRPPGWDVLTEARKALPNAVTAIGTSDETTMFVVGREPLRAALDVQAAEAQRALQRVYENYRQLGSDTRMVGGLPAVEWRFRGFADGHDWSVRALAVERDGAMFTLLGMTYADSDLIQIRENVIAKMIASVKFDNAK